MNEHCIEKRLARYWQIEIRFWLLVAQRAIAEEDCIMLQFARPRLFQAQAKSLEYSYI